jgi:hypothetical protein
VTIRSAGQTGVDRAALDAAMEAGLPVTGWCPRGRLAEDGPIDVRYPLVETPSAEPAQRTRWNVCDSHATLVLACGPVSGGTALTIEACRTLGRPCLVVDLAAASDGADVAGWAAALGVLNVAGPRESEAPGVYAHARRFLAEVFARLATG